MRQRYGDKSTDRELERESSAGWAGGNAGSRTGMRAKRELRGGRGAEPGRAAPGGHEAAQRHESGTLRGLGTAPRSAPPGPKPTPEPPARSYLSTAVSPFRTTRLSAAAPGKSPPGAASRPAGSRQQRPSSTAASHWWEPPAPRTSGTISAPLRAAPGPGGGGRALPVGCPRSAAERGAWLLPGGRRTIYRAGSAPALRAAAAGGPRAGSPLPCSRCLATVLAAAGARAGPHRLGILRPGCRRRAAPRAPLGPRCAPCPAPQGSPPERSASCKHFQQRNKQSWDPSHETRSSKCNTTSAATDMQSISLQQLQHLPVIGVFFQVFMSEHFETRL